MSKKDINVVVADLAEAIKEILDRTNGVFQFAAIHGYKWDGGSLVEPIMDLFQAHQQELLSELLKDMEDEYDERGAAIVKLHLSKIGELNG